MDEPGNTGKANSSPEYFTVDGNPEERLRERLAEVVRLLALADVEGKRAGPAAFRLLETYRGPFADALDHFGEALADYLAVSPDTPTLLEHPAFAEQLKPFLDLMRALPVLRRTQEWRQRGVERDELRAVALLASQPAFDPPTLLLGDAYGNTAMFKSYRKRVAVLGEWVHVEARTRVASQQEPVRLLKLAGGSGQEMEPLLADARCAANLLVTYVDEDNIGVRLVRQNIEQRLAHRPHILRADLLSLGSNPNRPRGAFDIVYALDLFNTLTVQQISDMLRTSFAFLKPGGVLFTGGFLPDVPRGEKAILAGLMGTQVQFLDEIDWRQLLLAATFDLDSTRLERMTPSTVLVAARRADGVSRMRDETPGDDLAPLALRLQALQDLVDRISGQIDSGASGTTEATIVRYRGKCTPRWTCWAMPSTRSDGPPIPRSIGCGASPGWRSDSRVVRHKPGVSRQPAEGWEPVRLP